MSNTPKYDAMLLAISECHSVDEVQDIVDEAKQLAAYELIAGNKDAERMVVEIRLRGMRMMAELLPKEKPPGVRSPAPRAISSQERTRIRQVGAVPEGKFEEYMAQAKKPSTRDLVAYAATEKLSAVSAHAGPAGPRDAKNAIFKVASFSTLYLDFWDSDWSSAERYQISHNIDLAIEALESLKAHIKNDSPQRGRVIDVRVDYVN